MADHQQYISIDEIIATYLSRSEQGVTKQFKVTHLAFDAMKQLGLDFFYTIKSVKLTVNANFTVNIPDDYLMYSKVGVFNDRGDVIPLYYNDKLTYFADQLSSRAQKTEDNTLLDLFLPTSPIFFNFWNGWAFENLYGLPSGTPFVGSFSIDSANGIILLNQNFGYPYIVLEYISSPEQRRDTYFVPLQFKEAIIAYIAWQDIIYLPNSRKAGISEKRDRAHNFYNERRLAAARYKPLHLEQAYEWNLRNQRFVVKS